MSIDSTPAHTQTHSTVNISPSTTVVDSYPGKGLGYDWQAVIAEVEAQLLDAELASLTAVPVD